MSEPISSPPLAMIYIDPIIITTPPTPKEEEQHKQSEFPEFDAGTMLNPMTPRLDIAPKFNSAAKSQSAIEIPILMDIAPIVIAPPDPPKASIEDKKVTPRRKSVSYESNTISLKIYNSNLF